MLQEGLSIVRSILLAMLICSIFLKTEETTRRLIIVKHLMNSILTIECKIGLKKIIIKFHYRFRLLSMATILTSSSTIDLLSSNLSQLDIKLTIVREEGDRASAKIDQ